MRCVIADEYGNPGFIDEYRKKYLEEVFKAKESKYKYKHVIDCNIDQDKQIMFIVGHNKMVKKYIENCIENNQTRYFTSADIIVLITCDFGPIRLSRSWNKILSGKLFRLKSDYYGVLTKVDDYGFGFNATAFEASLYRAREITAFDKFWNIAKKYVIQIA